MNMTMKLAPMTLQTRMCNLALLLALALVSTWVSAQGVIHDIKGDVRILSPGKPVVRAVKSMAVERGQLVATSADSTAVIRFIDGSVVALDQNTSMEISEYSYDPQQPAAAKALFSLARGAMRALTGAIGQKNPDSFRVATPVATIGVRGTDFMLAFNLASNTLTTGVINGTIAVTGANTVVVTVGGASITVGVAPSIVTALASIPVGTFGLLPPLQLNAIAAVLNAASGQAAAAAAAGGLGVNAAALAAAAAAAAAAAGGGGGGGGSATVTGTTGSTR